MYLFRNKHIADVFKCSKNQDCNTLQAIDVKRTENFLLNHPDLLCYTKADHINDAGLYVDNTFHDVQTKVFCPSKMKYITEITLTKMTL